MPAEEEDIFMPEKDSKYNLIFDMGDVKYKKCPVCKDTREYPDSFWPEGLCDYCADYFLTDPELFQKYLKAISKGYIKSVKDIHHFLSD